MAGRPSFRFQLALALLGFVALAALTRSFWLSALGSALVRDDGPAKAEIGVVLGGDYWGNRITRAAQLIRQGYIPAVLVSGPPGFYGQHECDFAIPYIVRQGYPAQWFIPLPHSALSTRDEASVVLFELRRRRARSFLLITSNYHTARAARLFSAVERGMGGGPSMRVVAAPDPFFRPDGWWHNREGEKTAFNEWSKTFAAIFGI